MPSTQETPAAAAPVDGPVLSLRIDDTRVTLLGTAHVSRRSAEQVESMLDSGEFGAVAVELCPSRHHALVNPDALARMDLMKVIREGRAAMVTANLAMGAYQQRIADQFGIEPGEEMRTAVRMAGEHGLPVLLIDREIGTTFKRTSRSLSFFKRWTLFSGVLFSLVSREEVTEDEIERLKEGDILETTFAEFAQDRDDLYRPLIHERDRYMAARLRQEAVEHPGKNILAVIGAGHLKGIAAELEKPDDPAATLRELDHVPEGSRWPKYIPWLIVALILGGFALGFHRSTDLGWTLVTEWVLINGGLSALGALLAAAHPLTVITAFVAAPLTSLNPTIGAGMVTATAEIFLRKPRVGDFGNLRHDTADWRGWWKNRVSRTLLVFLLSTLGSAVGTYLAGFRIFEKLSGS